MSSGRLLSARNLDRFSSDEWRKFSAETIEIRKMVCAYPKKVLEDFRRRMVCCRSLLS
jgi:hypothetical protein